MRAIAFLLASSLLASASPTRAQSIFDNLKQLKNSIQQLGNSGPQNKKGSAPAPQASSSVGASTVGEEGADMFPASAFSEDSSDTNLEAKTLLVRRPDTFDIRGFKLGMSPKEAFRVANKAGFRRRWNDTYMTTGSFDLEAKRIANYQLNKPISDHSKTYAHIVTAVARDGSSIQLTFTLEPVGPRLSTIGYNAKADGMTKEQFAAAIIKKYGVADINSGGGWTWQGGSKNFFAPSSSAVMVALFSESGATFDLHQSGDYSAAMKKALDARAQQIASSRGGGVKF